MAVADEMESIGQLQWDVLQAAVAWRLAVGEARQSPCGETVDRFQQCTAALIIFVDELLATTPEIVLPGEE